ncbi:TetR/AcrR family transcriptional regulator [Candidatus Dojkabacteria bacterium]|uniref:TetR/AcrR family transcriptional regulator n=1 Tax=Candidatus Dojkabacteria bacterium TaxID=2099670 RepID=A0A955L7A6_9BACT|nr:TetR/AcrR family transcriptional regulator [Candidatus Dojkabacteria bacterium]
MNTTKHKILAGAQQMFYQNSFNGTALDTLLGEIKVSKGSFFHHFKSKDDLLFELLSFEATKLFEKLEELFVGGQNPLQSLNQFLSWRLENFQTNGRLIYKLGAEVGNQNPTIQKKIKKIYGTYLSYLIQVITQAKKAGQLQSSTPTKELANFILYGLEGGTLSVTLIENSDQYSDVVEMMKRVIRSYRNIEYENFSA